MGGRLGRLRAGVQDWGFSHSCLSGTLRARVERFRAMPGDAPLALWTRERRCNLSGTTGWSASTTSGVIPARARYWDRPIEPPMDAAETDAIERCSRCLDDPQLRDLMEEGCLPVPAFGNVHSTHVKVATIGLNPSWTEFFSNRTQLRPATQRLSRLQDFRAASREFLTPEDLGKAACKRAEYFAADTRIAHDWFSNLTALLDACGRGRSYQNGQAVHLDLVACTTNTRWGRIQQEDAQRMIRNCQSHFRQTLSMLPADALLLADGRSAADTLVGDSRSWQHLKNYSETDGTVKPLLVRSGTLPAPAGEWRYCAWNMTVKHLPAEPLADLKQWLACSVRVGDRPAGAEDGASSK